jgi:hypothetical protein
MRNLNKAKSKKSNVTQTAAHYWGANVKDIFEINPRLSKDPPRYDFDRGFPVSVADARIKQFRLRNSTPINEMNEGEPMPDVWKPKGGQPSSDHGGYGRQPHEGP